MALSTLNDAVIPVLPEVPLIAAANSDKFADRPLVTAKSTLAAIQTAVSFFPYRLNDTVSVLAEANSLKVIFILV